MLIALVGACACMRFLSSMWTATDFFFSNEFCPHPDVLCFQSKGRNNSESARKNFSCVKNHFTEDPCKMGKSK